MSDVIKCYKGTDKDMRCYGGYQYEMGKTVVSDGAIRCGNKGFHACEAPLDVLRYFKLNQGNRYFLAEASGTVDRTDANDSKFSASKLTIKEEIGLSGLIKAQVEYTRKKAECGEAGGNRSNLAGGDRSNLAGGNRSNLAGGDYSNLAGGNCSVILARSRSKAKAGLNSVIVLTSWNYVDGTYKPVDVKAEIVDGERIKADTWYKLVDGEFKEAAE